MKHFISFRLPKIACFQALAVMCFILLTTSTYAQQKNDAKNDQNQDKRKALTQEEVRLRTKASAQNSAKQYYNLSRNIHEQKQVKESKFLLGEALERAQTKEERHRIFHNLGNVMMKEKKYQEAVEAYKNALRNNPNDEQTRYNFALAKDMLDKNPPPPSDGDNNKDNNKNQQDQDQNKQDQNKDQNQDQDKNQEDKKDPNESQKPQDGKDQQQPQQPQGKDRENIERLLEAINNEEKKVQDKIKAQQIKGAPVRREKEW